MKLLERLRKRLRFDRRSQTGQLEAEARGEAYAARSHKDVVRDRRVESDFPSRGGGQVGR